MLDLIAVLLSLILAATNIARDTDPTLTEIAQRRAVEIQSDFSHSGSPAGIAEVLAWNNSPDPAARALGQWQGSPPHWAVLTDSSYSKIGCGHSESADGRHWFVCLLAGPASVPVPVPVPVPEPPVLPDSAIARWSVEPATHLPTIPDTALEAP